MSDTNVTNDVATIKWTKKEILAGKFLPCVLLGIVYGVILIAIYDAIVRGVNYDNYGFGLLILCILLVAGIFLAVLTLQLIFNAKSKNISATAENIRQHEEDARLRWHVAYIIPIGYVIMVFLFLFARGISDKLNDAAQASGSTAKMAASGLATIGLLLGSYIVALILTKALNSYIMRKSGTNAELISDILDGVYDNEIPANLRTFGDVVGICTVLANGFAFTLKGAIFEYKVYNTFKKVMATTIKVLGIVVLVIGIFTFFAANSMTKTIGGEIERTIDEGKRQAIADARAETNYQARKAAVIDAFRKYGFKVTNYREL